MKKLINLLAWAFLAVLCACQGNTEELQPLDNNPTAISTKDTAIDYYWYEGQYAISQKEPQEKLATSPIQPIVTDQMALGTNIMDMDQQMPKLL